jgi:hypothetical protein
MDAFLGLGRRTKLDEPLRDRLAQLEVGRIDERPDLLMEPGLPARRIVQ